MGWDIAMNKCVWHGDTKWFKLKRYDCFVGWRWNIEFFTDVIMGFTFICLFITVLIYLRVAINL